MVGGQFVVTSIQKWLKYSNCAVLPALRLVWFVLKTDKPFKTYTSLNYAHCEHDRDFRPRICMESFFLIGPSNWTQSQSHANLCFYP